MALTAAERMKLYRQRLKNNPEKYEAHKKKQQERLKKNKKKIADMTEAEKKEQRQKWQQKKREQRKQNAEKKKKAMKKNKKQENPPDLANKIRYLAQKCNLLTKKCRKQQEQLSKTEKLTEKLKKRCYRFQRDLKEKKMDMNKLQARQELLESAMSNAYKNCMKSAEKTLFKKIAQNMNKNKSFLTSLLGLKGTARTKTKKAKKPFNEEINKFFLRDDVSRCTAGKKECKTKHQDKQQIRYLLDTLENLYKKYKDEGGRMKFTTFYKHKPFYVMSPHLKSRNTCLCIKHSNVNFQYAALQKHNVFKQKNVTDLLQTLFCDLASYSCVYGECDKCKTFTLKYDLNDNDLNKEVTWQQWERVDHEYIKGNTTLRTKKMVKSTKTGTIRQLISLFEANIQTFKIHHYNVNHQQKEYQNAIKDLKTNEALIVCDFSENYETKMAEEIQSMHFGASKSQITLQTGMIYWSNKAESFCTISPDNSHQPPAIWAHLKPVLKLIKEKTPAVDVVHFYSDGPTSQYRQKHNFDLLSIFQDKLELKYSTWSFFEAGHGKGVADGIGGTVKRTLDKHVCFGKDVTNANDAFEILRDTMKVVKIFYIPESDIAEVSSLLPPNVKPLKGTLHVHQVISDQKHVIKYRDVSCFCSRGLCSCYALKIHHLTNIEDTVSLDNDQIIVEDLLEFSADFPADIDIVDIFDSVTASDTFDLTIQNDNEDESALEDLTSLSRNNSVSYNQSKPNILTTGPKPTENNKNTELQITTKSAFTACSNNSEGVSYNQSKPKTVITGPKTTENKNSEPESTTNTPPVATSTSNNGIFYQNNKAKLLLTPVKKNPLAKNEPRIIINKTACFPIKFKKVKVLMPTSKVVDKKPINVPQIISNVSDLETKTNAGCSSEYDYLAQYNTKVKTEKNINKTKSIKTIVKRTFKCDICRNPLVTNRIGKCMSCKKWFCWSCSEGNTFADYICQSCLIHGPPSDTDN